jgi:hypothetical protein
VPVAAARQPEVGAADPQPVVALRGGEHVVEKLAVGLLELLALDQRPARLGDLHRERVADLLQRTEVEHPRRARGGDPVRDDQAPEALGDQPAELPLELGDLPAQLGAGQTLIDRDSFEHSPHSQSLSRLEGRCSNP